VQYDTPQSIDQVCSMTHRLCGLQRKIHKEGSPTVGSYCGVLMVGLSRAELQNECHHWSLCSTAVVCPVVNSLQSHVKETPSVNRLLVHTACVSLCA
jgi:hypothetical protein